MLNSAEHEIDPIHYLINSIDKKTILKSKSKNYLFLFVVKILMSSYSKSKIFARVLFSRNS